MTDSCSISGRYHPNSKQKCASDTKNKKKLKSRIDFFLITEQVINQVKRILKLINYSCSSYPTRASYSGQVDEFRNSMKNELQTWPCLKTRV